MQYILNETEYQELTNKKESERQINIRNIALEYAKSTIIDLSDKSCIHDFSVDECDRFSYCNECPLGSLYNNRESNGLICTELREYSK